MSKELFIVLTVFVLILFNLPTHADRWDKCSQGCEETVVYRVVNPGLRGHGKLWCCDHVCGGKASTSGVERCKDVYKDCEKVDFNDIPLDEWSRHFNEKYLAVGESAIKKWKEDNKAALEHCENTFEAPDQALRKEFEMVSVFRDVEVCIAPGTRIGKATFLGACELGPKIYVSMCNISLKKPVVRQYSPDQYWVALAQAIQDEQTAEHLQKAIDACVRPTYCKENGKTYSTVRDCWADCRGSLKCFGGACCVRPKKK